MSHASTLTRVYRLNLPACFILVPFAGMGCGGNKLAEVSGHVTYQGKPIAAGASIYFTNAETGMHILAKIDESGAYRVSMADGYGLPPGSYGVAVVPPMLTATNDMLEKYRAGGPPPELVAFPSIPVRFRTPDTSQLRLELTPKGAVFDVDMVP